MLEKLGRLRKFLLVDLWREAPSPSRVKAAVIHVVRIAILAGRDFVTDKCGMRATALAFVTLLSLVPLLAFGFSVLKGLGVQEQLKPALMQLAAGQEEVLEQILEYVEKTNVKALGTIGLVFLIWTTVKTLGTIEKSFNDIWAVSQSRSLFRKVTDYISVLVIAPILLLAAMSLTGMLQSKAVADHLLLGFASRVLMRLTPFIGTWIAFAAVYIFMPNTKVRVLSAATGGVLAGTIWQLAFWVYTSFQVGMARYNAVYGTFAALPVFMIWLHLSWAIVLFGAEVSWATQNVGRYWEERRAAGVSYASREAIALRLMASLAVAFYRGGGAVSVGELARRLKAPSRLVRDILHNLVSAGLCTEVVQADATAYQPGRALERITPADVVAALRAHGQGLELSDDGVEASIVSEMLEASVRSSRERLEGTTLRDIASRLAEAAPADRPAAHS